MGRRVPEAALPPALAQNLLRWFGSSRRPLPWRRSRDPYRIWVAEVLLQQTRVAAVVPYFERFVAQFPTLESLAAAPVDAVLKQWEGAGYYARARHLHATARLLVRERGGAWPRTPEELATLPGIGPYIAAAIASLAFRVPVVALDANGGRVASRWTLERRDPRRPIVRRRLESALRSILPAESPGEFNEAVMELGETVCLPVSPRCDECPVARYCRATRELANPGSLPVRPRRRTRPRIRAAIVALHRGGRWWVQRRPSKGLLGGLWEFPGGKIERGESPADAAIRELWEEAHLRVRSLDRIGIVRHEYSHFRVELHVFRADLPPGRGPRSSGAARWVSVDGFERLPRPRATMKAWGMLLRDRGRSSR